MSEEQPPFEIIKNENYGILFVTGPFGGLATKDGKIMFYIDKLEI